MITLQKTTTNLPVDLMQKVMDGYPGLSKTALLIMGLKELNRRKSVEDFISLRGKVKIKKYNVDVMRDRNHHKWTQARKRAFHV